MGNLRKTERVSHPHHKSPAKTTKPEEDIEDITLWAQPVETIKIFLLVLVGWIQEGTTLLIRYFVPILIVVLGIGLPHAIDGPHTPVYFNI